MSSNPIIKLAEWTFTLALAIGCSVVILAMALVVAQETNPDAGATQAFGSESPSTPKSAWQRGVVPELYQTDPLWGSQPYGDGTIATHGCGPTCLSMAYVALSGKLDKDPAAMASFSENHGFVDEGMTTWTLMNEGASQLGLKSRELPNNVEALRLALLNGEPVIASVGPGDFTSDGHFIVLVDYLGDGSVALRDPNSAKRTHQSWKLTDVLSQCQNLWALSA